MVYWPFKCNISTSDMILIIILPIQNSMRKYITKYIYIYIEKKIGKDSCFKYKKYGRLSDNLQTKSTKKNYKVD